jgi:enoyl-CoA hydratase/carnithine racemase
MAEPPIFLQRDPPVATVVFNRPEARNALNEAMQLALPPMLGQLCEDAAIRVLIIRGAGLRGVAEPAALAAALYDSEDFHAGVQAFLGKQPLPPFHGR